jgi:hypothetical protein
MENGVKNLNGAKPFPMTCSYHGFGNACLALKRFEFLLFNL